MSWDPRLQCDAHGLTYDFDSKTGTLRLEAGHCCDMSGCLELFKAIDPNVRQINTFSGEEADTAYLLRAGEWTAWNGGVRYA